MVKRKRKFAELVQLGEVKATARGFELIRFKDENDNECHLQESSLAVYVQPGTSAIWLGIGAVKAKILATQAGKFSIKTFKTEGYVDYPVPPEVTIPSRMHLGREQVQALIFHLQQWLDKDTFQL